MTNRTHELFEFAQMEPVAVDDMRMMLVECDDEEVGHVEQVADNLKQAIATLGTPDGEFFEML